MPVEFTYTPPAVNGAVLMHGLVEGAEKAGAAVLLAASEPLVPVLTGELKISGHVEHDGSGAAVVYSAVNPADGYDYAAKQHEDETLNHPNGGQAHYLSDPMHTAHAAISVAMVAALKV